MGRARRTLVWSPEADNDLLDIWAYLAEEASSEIADRQIESVYNRAQALTRSPFVGRRRDELIVGVRSVLLQPYVLFYRVSDLSVEIVRVVHGRRDLKRIFSIEHS
jgi:toxin ParE1/3/4